MSRRKGALHRKRRGPSLAFSQGTEQRDLCGGARSRSDKRREYAEGNRDRREHSALGRTTRMLARLLCDRVPLIIPAEKRRPF